MNRYVAGWVNYSTCITARGCLPGSDIFWSGECSSTCGGDDRSKGFNRAGGHPPGSIKSLEWSRSRYMPDIGQLASFEVKMIGKPYAGELQVRFDEGERDFVPWTILNGHEVGDDGYGQRWAYRMLRLFSTLPVALKRLEPTGSINDSNFWNVFPYLNL